MNRHYNERALRELEALCPCSVDPDGPGPLQECPVDGDGATFVAEVLRLRAVEAQHDELVAALAAAWPGIAAMVEQACTQIARIVNIDPQRGE